ncbi:MAG: oligoendopeptidase F [Clostridiales bacterium]|nr:oligoendopeptidase F [Clostridiales bacterium]MDD7034739.1 oligoendopeptidase F [Bacillota bacterium]MDY2919785.1 oligoendopeptidase F [Lentihominibacter sp.]
MGSKVIRSREESDSRYKWNIEAMMPDESIIDPELDRLTKEAAAYGEKYAGHLTESGETLLAALKEKDEIFRQIEKIYVYAHMKRDEDNSNSRYSGMVDKCIAVISAASASFAFFTPELLEADEKLIDKYIEETPGLDVYEFLLKDAFRGKEHVLSHKEEAIMAQMSEVTGATNDIFTMLNNADITFADVTDEKGEKSPLTHGSYIKYMESRDRKVREEAYNSMYDAYKEHINTISTTYSYNTRTDAVVSRIRGYESSRAAALFGDNIPGSVYDNLVATVNEYLPQLHRYTEIRKELLGYDKMFMYDMYVPLIDVPEKTVTFPESIEIISEALRPLGDEYIASMKEGISQGWIDVYENKGKTSGAYSFGCYDSYPYILLNYTDTLKDVFTVIHEMGHSMHSLYTRKVQPYVYGSHSIFTAEVASTVNENLLMHHLLDECDDMEMRKYLLNMHLEEFRTTLFRQTMFAEFEDLTHKAVEEGRVLTVDMMCDEYEALNAKYYGPAVEKDDTIRYEWARIPHFYRSFYVYKYATGYSAATAIAGKILREGCPAADDYLKFLTTGESDYPIELLKIAGVDMSTKKPVEDAMKVFTELLDEFESLVK